MPWSFDACKRALQQDYTIYLVACSGETIVGYCGMYVSLDEGEIPNVAVRREYRRGGIGARMLEALLAEAQKRKVASVFLEVRAGNEPAQALYRKLGFEAAGIRKRFYENPTEDAVIMWKK